MRGDENVKLLVTGLSLAVILLTLTGCRGLTKFPRPKPNLHKPHTEMFCRYNMRLQDGYYANWYNWLALTESIPIGTRLQVRDEAPKRWGLHDPETGKTYLLYTGSKDEASVGRFLRPEPLELPSPDTEVGQSIRNGIATIGMTKEQVYWSLGPPVWAGGGATKKQTYLQILSADHWMYYTKRGARVVEVYFDPKTGKADKGLDWRRDTPSHE